MRDAFLNSLLAARDMTSVMTSVAAYTADMYAITFFYSVRNARIASAVLATAIPSVHLSVCPSVRHMPVLCQNDDP